MSDTLDPTELKFEPFVNVIINRHEDTEQFDKVYCRETAAILYAIAYGVVEAQRHYTRIVERAHARDRERYQKLKEEKRELEDKMVELDRRLRDPNRLRPDPLGPSVPRGNREPKLVIEPPPKNAEWCPGSWATAKLIDKKDIAFKCDRCGRMLIPRQGYTHADGTGQVPRHKWGGRFSA